MSSNEGLTIKGGKFNWLIVILLVHNFFISDLSVAKRTLLCDFDYFTICLPRKTRHIILMKIYRVFLWVLGVYLQ